MAITYGMSVEEFWRESPDLFWAYRFSYYEKMRAEQQYDNFKLWLQGAYFYEAVSVALANGFGKGKATYPNKPYILTKEEEEQDFKDKQNALVNRIKNRISEVQKIKGKDDSTNKRE
ncbi:MAG: hypothetical protein J6T15_03725 [Bacilli bacterium]|nr:hypothetical protein [Bacilli bacterium]